MLFGGFVPAQNLSPTPGLPSAAPSRDLSSPAAAVTSFLTAMREQRYSDARRALDLSNVPFPVRDTEGDRYAKILAAIMARIPGLDPSTLPATSAGDTYDIKVLGPSAAVVGDLVLNRHSNGEWKFSALTVSQLPHIFSLVESEPQTGAIGYFPDPEADPSMEVRSAVPSVLLTAFLWLELWQWVGLAVLALASILLSRFVRWITKVVLHIFFRRWEALLAPVSMVGLKRSTGVLAATALWWWATPYLGLTGTSLLIVVVLIKLFWILGIAWLLGAFFDVLMDAMGARASAVVERADHILIPIARKFGKFVILVGAILAFAASMDVNIAGLITGLGIGGLVVALAAKDSVENIFGSLTILFDMPFGIGDWIKLADVEGSVEEINLRSTRIRTGKDTLITLPNSNLIKASVENFGARRFRQVGFTLSVSYANDLRRLQDFVEKARAWLAKNPKVRADNAAVALNSLGDNAIGILIQCSLITDDYAEELKLREQMIAELIELARQSKVLLGPMPWMPHTAPQALVGA